MADTLLATIPILLILVLMVAARWGAARAGPAGWSAALVIAAVRFGAGLPVLAVAQGKALLLGLDVLLVVWAAYGMYRVAHEAGAIEVVSRAIRALTVDRAMHALMIGWAFASFLQGVGGYGVPVAVTAPLLLGLGFSPLQAMVIPSVGHAWAVTYGSVAASFQALMAASGLEGADLAPPTSLLLGAAALACGAGVLHAAGGWGEVRRHAWALMAMGLVMGGVQAWLAGHGLWSAAAFGAGLAGIVIAVGLARRGVRTGPPGEASPPAGDLALAWAGYALLVGLILLVQFVPSVKEALSPVQLRVLFPAVATARGHLSPAQTGRTIAWLVHPGTLLTVAAAVSYLLYRSFGRFRPGAGGRVLRATIGRMGDSGLGVVSMVSMAVIMDHAGMTAALASGLAAAFGGLYPLASPWIGALGAFMTGSNTNSNALFTSLQQGTALMLGLAAPAILAGQTAGAAVASVLAPTKLLVASGTVGLAGEEGSILRRLALYVVPILLGLSFLVLMLVSVG